MATSLILGLFTMETIREFKRTMSAQAGVDVNIGMAVGAFVGALAASYVGRHTLIPCVKNGQESECLISDMGFAHTTLLILFSVLGAWAINVLLRHVSK
jgi:hypothetical protein